MASLIGEGTFFSGFPSIKVELEQIAEYGTNHADYCSSHGAQELQPVQSTHIIRSSISSIHAARERDAKRGSPAGLPPEAEGIGEKTGMAYTATSLPTLLAELRETLLRLIAFACQSTAWPATRSRRRRVADGGRFELPIPLRVCRISSAVHSTTLPPVRDALMGCSGKRPVLSRRPSERRGT